MEKYLINFNRLHILHLRLHILHLLFLLLLGEYKENRFQKVIGEGFQSIKLIPFYKRTYCNKKFSSEEEQNRHELEWHI
ncbi:MAG TPA: hypothetical protein VFR65_04845 [Nitrososphaeraceae archaeon]|nr:hypothetical protein [Nitrososphaeraceae archaeon]